MSRRAGPSLLVAASSFVGRRADLDRLGAFYEDARLVTILGPGGVGKTRLAMRYAESMLDAFTAQGGVRFVDLSELRDGTSALSTIAAVLELDLEGLASDENVADAIGRRLARLGRVLLVLDNVEQLARALAASIERWVRAAPSARVLVTSRVALGTDAEQVLTLGPLSREEASELFLQRARAVRPDDDDGSIVAEIVDAIDRMPLAIELAAARTRVLSLADLRARLTSPLEILQSKEPGDRHGSLRRVVHGSLQLLGAGERRCFALASVFRNGFALEDAEAVFAAVLPGARMLDVFDTLVRASLVRVDVVPAEPARYAYFDTIRSVAEEMAAGDELRDVMLAAHARHYAARASSGRSVERELENLRLAHETSVRLAGPHAGERAMDAVAVAARLEPLLSARGGRPRAALFEATLDALSRTGAPADRRRHDEARALAHLARGLALRELGESAPARADFETALTLATEAERDGLCAVALTRLGALDDVAGDTERARERLERALDLLARTPDDAVRAAREAEASRELGHAHRREGSLSRAEHALDRAASTYRALGDDVGLAAALYELAVVDIFAGRERDASARIDEGLAAARRRGARVIDGTLTMAKGCLLQQSGEIGDARRHFAEAAATFGDHGSRHREASALFYLATTYLERDAPAEALAILAQARRRVASVGAPRYHALIAACSASALAMLERASEAREEIANAELALARVRNEPALAAAVSIHRSIVEIIAGETAAHAARPLAESLVAASPNDDSRFALRLLRAIAGDALAAADEDGLTVWSDGSAFLAPGAAAPVLLPERSPLRGILDHLAKRRIEAPGDVVPIEEIIAAGWPNERMHTEAALNRAYVAIATLRKKGLRGMLESSGGGYMLSPAAPVRRESARPR